MRDNSRTILEGQPGKMVFRHDIVHLKNNMFFLCGQLVALSLAQGGHGVRCFAPAMLNLLICEQIKPPLTDSKSSYSLYALDCANYAFFLCCLMSAF